MFAYFHSNGTTPSFNDKLNTLASGILICSTVSISNFGGMPSTPGDLLSFIAFILPDLGVFTRIYKEWFLIVLDQETVIGEPVSCVISETRSIKRD